ncbi:MAG: hypothetical protein U1F36_19405 [Planctomycetota bacterium]
MSICDEIRGVRTAGVVRCGFSQGGSSLNQLAAEFGLSSASECYHEIDANAARRLAFLILTQDLAYNAALVDPALASSLVDQFFAAFGSRDVHYFTNGTFHEAPGEKATFSGVTWQPATAATFDTGVLIIGPVASGTLWVEDED